MFCILQTKKFFYSSFIIIPSTTLFIKIEKEVTKIEANSDSGLSSLTEVVDDEMKVWKYYISRDTCIFVL